MSTESTRCLVADDHPALVAAVSAYLEEHGFEVVGPATDGHAALAAAGEERPPLALLDYRMPGVGGAELVRRVRRVSPGTLVAVYTADADEALVADALAAGAQGVVLKDAPLDDVVRALRSVLLGRPYVDPGLAPAAIGGTRGGARDSLTRREVEVLRLLADGHQHGEIGRRLGIGAETVRTHARKAADRLGARTRTQAVATAIRHELI
ncbi:MAG: response regulator [Pseudomonadota bacterium]